MVGFQGGEKRGEEVVRRVGGVADDENAVESGEDGEFEVSWGRCCCYTRDREVWTLEN